MVSYFSGDYWFMIVGLIHIQTKRKFGQSPVWIKNVETMKQILWRDSGAYCILVGLHCTFFLLRSCQLLMIVFTAFMVTPCRYTITSPKIFKKIVNFVLWWKSAVYSKTYPWVTLAYFCRKLHIKTTYSYGTAVERWIRSQVHDTQTFHTNK